MCGIAGEVGYATRPALENLAQITEALRHRGPDDGGVWTSPDETCVLGHRRLSIIDLSPLGHQPMVDPETDNTIVFNGEIYNFQTLRAECESLGDRFNSQSDTEVILALYRRYGTACLSKLRGMFAFAIWDTSARRLFLARDRVGKKPLHYAANGQSLIFSSELRPLSRHPLVDRALDTEALELYLQLQSVPAPWTIYRGIRKLPPAHFALFDANGLRVERYWNVDYRPKIQLSSADALEAFEEKLTEAVRLRLISDVPVGALLSGGVDSSVVVALMARLSDRPVRTFSIGFSDQAYNELPYAAQVAAICGTTHTPQMVQADIADLLPLIARHHGEPYGDHSALPSFALCRTTRRSVSVVLNGDGGDELLGGYHRYALSNTHIALASLTSKALPPPTMALIASRFKGSKLSDRAMRRLLMRFVCPDLGAMAHQGFFNDVEMKQLLPNRSHHNILPNWQNHWIQQATAFADNPIDRMLWFDNHTYLSDDLLPKMDVASMHVGLEARSPLLDHEVIEFCASLPYQLKVKNQTGKVLLKQLAEKYFPREFVYRRKMGFSIPVADWLRGPLLPIFKEICGNPALMEPLNQQFINQGIEDFLDRGNSYLAPRLWLLLMFGFWRLQEMSDL